MRTIVELKKSGTHRYLTGHPWIYASEVEKVKGNPLPRESVVVKDGWGRVVGSGLLSPQSEIRVRLYSRQEIVFDAALLQARLQASVERRGNRECCRLVWSEADGLPGLVVDRYGEVVVFQILHAAMEAWREELVESMVNILRPRALIDRSDASVRKKEGLQSRVEVVKGSYQGTSCHHVGNVMLELDLLKGQKTGAYLDQVDNYLAVAKMAKGRRVLDCFANVGGFGLHCARAGAKSVEAVDSSADAVREGRKNSELNQVTIQWHEANAFDWLRQAVVAKKRYDLIILDPPSFTRTRGRVAEAMKGYKEIHVRALQMLESGGCLATYCCSHHVSLEGFEAMIREAAGDVRRSLLIRERHFQGSDHPVLLGMPETEYLKGVVLETI